MSTKTSFRLEWNGPEITRRTAAAGRLALKKSALDLQGRSAEEAPIDKGDLRGNAGIDDSQLRSKSIVFVGYSLPYALRQHEELDFNHPLGGKAKFLEDPFRSNIKRYNKFIASAINGVTD